MMTSSSHISYTSGTVATGQQARMHHVDLKWLAWYFEMATFCFGAGDFRNFILNVVENRMTQPGFDKGGSQGN